MPDGFEPHREIQRIYNIRDMQMWFRHHDRVEDIQREWLNCLHDENPAIRMDAIKWGTAMGFGKLPQAVKITVEDDRQIAQRRVVILPDNGRKDQPVGPVIDA